MVVMNMWYKLVEKTNQLAHTYKVPYPQLKFIHDEIED